MQDRPPTRAPAAAPRPADGPPSGRGRALDDEWTPPPPAPKKRGLGLPLVLAGVLAFLLGVGGVLWATGAAEYGVWWLTNREPPAVALAAPAEPRRGTIPLEVRLEPRGRARIVEAQVDGRPLAAEGQLAVDGAALPDGQHRVTVVAEDTSWRKNRATATATVTTDNTPPQLAVDSQPPRVEQGRTWVLRIRSNEPATVNARLGDRQLDVQAGNGFGWAIVGFSPTTPTAALPLVVDGTDAAGNRTEQRATVEVIPGDFPLDRVDVPPAMLPLLALDIRAAEDARLSAHYKQSSGPRLWEGRWVRPVQGEIITEFGDQRSYNSGPVVPHHQGADIVAPNGQPVLAPARGRLLVTDEVRLRGKVAILDHGGGVFTTYAHLSSVDVPVGAIVERGQPFAKVGNTGLSTGPHLHWELWVNGENVDPLEWTQRDLP